MSAMIKQYCIKLLSPELTSALLARVPLHVARMETQTAAGLACQSRPPVPMVIALFSGPTALVIRHLTRTASQLALAVLAHLAGASLPLRIDQH
eukprot:6072326-Pyramimonas_sp.AAC.1